MGRQLPEAAALEGAALWIDENNNIRIDEEKKSYLTLCPIRHRAGGCKTPLQMKATYRQHKDGRPAKAVHLLSLRPGGIAEHQ